MAAITFKELTAHLGISVDELNKECSDDHITSISLFLANWQTVAPHLGLNEVDEEDVQEEETKAQDKRYKTLRKWKAKNLFKATYTVLVDVFLKIGRADLAKKVCRLLIDEVPTSSETNHTQGRTETQRVSHGTEQDEVAEVTKQNKRNITVKYATLLTNVYSRLQQKLQQKEFDVRQFRLFLIARIPPGDFIPDSTDFGELFEAITRNGLWDFLNYQLLEDVVQRFGADDEQMRDWVKEYIADLAGFKACAKLVNFIPIVESDSSFDESDTEEPAVLKQAKYDRRYYRKLSLQLKVKMTDKSLSYIYDIWLSVSQFFSLPPLSALLDCICKGSITVVWLIPTRVVPQFLKRIHQARDFFQRHQIASLVLDGHYVYDEKTSTMEQRQSIVDPQQLFQACKRGNLEMCLNLLAADVDVDIKDILGGTSLIVASYNGHLDIVALMLGCGADVNMQDKDGWTPLIAGSRHGDANIVSLLLACQANVNTQLADGRTALYTASFNGHGKVVEHLMAAGANPDLQKKTGATPLKVASQEGHKHVVEKLLHGGASIDKRTKNGVSALMIASQEGHYEVAGVLIEQGANVNLQDETEHTALMIASYHGHCQVVKKLLAAGAHTDIRDKIGQSALSLASQQNHHDICELLAEKVAQLSKVHERRTAFGTPETTFKEMLREENFISKDKANEVLLFRTLAATFLKVRLSQASLQGHDYNRSWNIQVSMHQPALQHTA